MMKVNKNGERFRVSLDEFIRVWQASSSVKEVCDHFNATYVSVCCRATYFRKKGAPLKKFKGS
jgi:hypothetical protein